MGRGRPAPNSIMKKLTALIILDGFGYREDPTDNAVLIDGIKNIKALWHKYPHTLIGASGLDVGLPDGQMGNSEVGHMNLGAGRVVFQDYPRIDKSIKDGDFFENPAFMKAVANCKEHDSSLHLLGLCSDGGIHSRLNHLYALLELAKREGLKKVYVHCFMDGRDTPPTSGVDFMREVAAKAKEIGVGEIATVQGRFWGMDRDKRYDRVKLGYDAIVNGEGVFETDPVEAMEHSYANGKTDEFVVPAVITRDGKPLTTVQPNDSVIFFNFRTDRPKEITEAFIFEDYNYFERERGYIPVCYVCMTLYRDDFADKAEIAYKPLKYENLLGPYLSKHGLKQLRLAESEKMNHVSFFFNGGTNNVSEGEDHIFLDSPKVKTYDLAPAMRAYDLTDIAVEKVRAHEYDVLIMNFANPDMVGHTAVRDSVIAAVHAVDECVGRLVSEIVKEGGSCLITADHGNCETMVENGNPMAAHTTNPVPRFDVADDAANVKLKEGGRLGNIAPTLLEMMGLEKPSEMTEDSLLIHDRTFPEP